MKQIYLNAVVSGILMFLIIYILLLLCKQFSHCWLKYLIGNVLE